MALSGITLIQLAPLPCQKEAGPPALRISRSPLRTPSSAIGRRTPIGGPTCMSVLRRSSGAVAVREAMPATAPAIRTTAGLGSISALSSVADCISAPSSHGAASRASGAAGSASGVAGLAGVAGGSRSLSEMDLARCLLSARERSRISLCSSGNFACISRKPSEPECAASAISNICVTLALDQGSCSSARACSSSPSVTRSPCGSCRGIGRFSR
mmetsp:Transcript_7785/g.18393  ORF Transcript_7785/g.18393 Transcript_7785/m.18393 type:complete len:214 (-) Transcript_7785:55-696(-)